MFFSPYHVRLEDNPGMGQHMDGTMSFTFALLLFIFLSLRDGMLVHITSTFENRHLGVLGQHAMATLFFHPFFLLLFPKGGHASFHLRSRHGNKTFTLSICSTRIFTYLCLSQLRRSELVEHVHFEDVILFAMNIRGSKGYLIMLGRV